MIKNLFKLFLLGGMITIVSCSKNDSSNNGETTNDGPYKNGFFIVNEGSYNATFGDLNYYSYDSSKLKYAVFDTANGTTIPSDITTTLEFGTIYNHNIYLAVKASYGSTTGADFVVADESTLKEKYRITGKDWRAFVGINDTLGLVSTSEGVYRLNTSTHALGANITAIPNTEIGEMINTDNYIFAASFAGTYIVKKTDWSLSKTYPSILQGFVTLPNGKIVGETATGIISINASTLDTTSVNLPSAPLYSQYSWTPSSITASTKENAVFIATTDNKIYKYIDGNTSSISSAFITLPDGKYFYGCGVRYDKSTNQIIAIATTSTWGDNSNFLYFYNASTGNLENTLEYSGYYFPSTIVFHN